MCSSSHHRLHLSASAIKGQYPSIVSSLTTLTAVTQQSRKMRGVIMWHGKHRHKPLHIRQGTFRTLATLAKRISCHLESMSLRQLHIIQPQSSSDSGVLKTMPRLFQQSHSTFACNPRSAPVAWTARQPVSLVLAALTNIQTPSQALLRSSLYIRGQAVWPLP